MTTVYINPEMKRALTRARREREVRIQKLIILAVSVLIIMIIFIAGSFISKAENSEEISSEKYFREYVVKDGDSVWSIAESNYDFRFYKTVNDYAEEILCANHLADPDMLICGEHLIVPYYI